MFRRVRNALSAAPSEGLLERRVLIHYPVVEMIERACRQCAHAAESGGILLGAVRGPHLEVTDFTEPGPDDVRSMFQFVRQDTRHQKAADKAWAASHQIVTFAGEWHTHPVGEPIPSSVDRKNWAALARRTRYPMLFLLAAPGKWKGFLAMRGRLLTTQTELSVYERGHLGIVMR
jgi:integrative and conjugative element protein (TIGR02256 family)